MVSTQLVREQIDRYADGSLSVDALEEWLASESWDMRRWASAGLQRLIETIQSAFIDYSAGNMAEHDLNQFLLQRREQLHRSLEVTKALEAQRERVAILPLEQMQPAASVAGSQSIMVTSSVAA